MVTTASLQSHDIKGMDDEVGMKEFLKTVKRINPKVTTYFYLDTYKAILDMADMAAQFAKHPSWALRYDDGTPVMTLDGFKVYDLSQPEVRQWWMSTCLNATKETGGDGCYADTFIPHGIVRFKPPISIEKAKLFKEGLLNMTREVQEALGRDKLLIGKYADQPYVNAVQLEFFEANNESINNLSLGLANGKVMQAHVPIHTVDCKTGDLTDYIAAFLIAAGEHSYFGCGMWYTYYNDTEALTWRPEYDRPLGAPLGPATYKDGLWKREFARGTKVQFDTTSNTGTISWGKIS